MRNLKPFLAATLLVSGAVTIAGAQNPPPADSARRPEVLRSRGWMARPFWRDDFRAPRVFVRPIPRFRYDGERFRLDAMDRAMERMDRARDRRFDLEERLRARQFDRQDRLWRRQEELHGRMMDRLHERMDRLHDLRPFRPRRFRMI
jgi:hypothetical protein